jgi:hypothetical protein
MKRYGEPTRMKLQKIYVGHLDCKVKIKVETRDHLNKRGGIKKPYE